MLMLIDDRFSKKRKILEYLRDHPDSTKQQISDALGFRLEALKVLHQQTNLFNKKNVYSLSDQGHDFLNGRNNFIQRINSLFEFVKNHPGCTTQQANAALGVPAGTELHRLKDKGQLIARNETGKYRFYPKDYVFSRVIYKFGDPTERGKNGYSPKPIVHSTQESQAIAFDKLMHSFISGRNK